jgi:hypothetical protein
MSRRSNSRGKASKRASEAASNSPEPVFTAATTDLWRELRGEFKSLEAEENKISWEKHERCELFLEFSAESELKWTLRGGPNQDFRERGAAISRRAGVAAGASPTALRADAARIHWFNELHSYLKEKKDSRLRTFRPGQDGFVESFCGASATLCSHLEGTAPIPEIHRVSQKAEPVPVYWNELKNLGSISVSRAANLLRYDSKKSISRLFDKRELTKTQTGRVACDDKLKIALRKKHGDQVVR